MAMSFVKVYFDFEERTEMLNEVEKGRLLLTMLRYAQGKTLPELKGNERFLFPVFKANIDRDAAAYVSKVENGSKGGRPAKPKITEENLTKPNGTEDNLILKNKKEEQEQEKEQEQEIISSPRKRGSFKPPTIEEVQAYATEKGWTAQEFNAEVFVDFYASKGWKVGGDKMQNWKRAASGWVARRRQKAPSRPVLDTRTNDNWTPLGKGDKLI